MTLEIESGWRPGLIGWTIAEHGRYYATNWDFRVDFEARVAAEMGEFAARLGAPGTHLLSASDPDGFLGTVTVDGGDAEEGRAHLRWFFTAERARGLGLGQQLLARAIETARADGAKGLYLFTFRGLDAARQVYLKAGFHLTEEREAETWGTPVSEQRYALDF